MSTLLENYVAGRWPRAAEEGKALHGTATGQEIADACCRDVRRADPGGHVVAADVTPAEGRGR